MMEEDAKSPLAGIGVVIAVEERAEVREDGTV